uniref:Lipase_3 domain-containing protein n=2 Tax=Caenorhabditis japonica TaxID=281687 RepID=A0A8R1IUE9_CAEJA
MINMNAPCSSDNRNSTPLITPRFSTTQCSFNASSNMKMAKINRLFLFFVALFFLGTVEAKYSDAWVRQRFPTIFAATEAPDPARCLEKLFRSYEIKKHVQVPCDELGALDTCSGLSFASHDDKAIVLVFRGTKGTIQLLVESEELVYRNKTQWYGGGQVGFYFARAFNVVWNNGMKDDFNTLRSKYPGYEIWVGGHSLGGSMAALASNYLVANQLVKSSKIKLVTFGEPRTGNKEFADQHDALVPFSYRVIHRKDIVPHLPLDGMDGFHHHRNEIWYNNDMSTPDFVECDEQEGRNCSDAELDWLIKDHHRYFGVYMYYYGARNCTGDPAN